MSGAIPAQLGNLANLYALRVDYNTLEGEIPATIINLINLGSNGGSTELGYNKLTSSVPAVTTFLNVKDPDWAATQTVPPTNVQATAFCTNTVRLTWTPIPYTAHGGYYQISYATTPGGPYTVYGVTGNKSASSYLASGLSAAIPYYFVVRTFTPAHDNQSNALLSATSREVSATVAAQVLSLAPGGSVANCGGDLTLRAPTGLPQSLTITYTALMSPSHGVGEFTLAGLAFRLEACDASGRPVTVPSTPLSLTLRYVQTVLPPGVDENALDVWRYDPTSRFWVPLEVLSRDPANDTLTVLLDHLSEFALMASPPVLHVALDLRAGWNLISLPLAPENAAITQALSSMAGRYDLAYTYDAASQPNPWKKYNISAPSFLNTLRTVSETMGLWIRASSAVSLTITGTIGTQRAVSLRAGWNLVGYPSFATQPVTVALASIAGHYDLVYAYDATSQASPWKKYNTAAPPFLNTLKEMGPGWGYWIRTQEDCLWQMP